MEITDDRVAIEVCVEDTSQLLSHQRLAQYLHILNL